MNKRYTPSTLIYLFFLSASLLYAPFSFGQVREAILPQVSKPVQFLPCGTPDTNREVALILSKMVEEIANKERLITRGAPSYYIAVKPQIIQKDDGSGGLSLNDLHFGLADLNKQYAPLSVQFYICGTSPNYINNSSLYNNTTDVSTIRVTNNVNNAHNIYFTGILNNISGFSYGSTHQRVNNATFLLSSYVLGGKTLPHELGHFFGLAHTFLNSASPTITDRELVTRNSNETPPRLSANCSTAGDFICDTPADPYDLPGGHPSVNCVYTGTVTDANGDPFSPSVTNYMNYYFCTPYDFTPGQFTRMSAGLAYNLSPSSDPTTNYTLDCPETVQPAPANVTAANLSATVNQGVNITWTSASVVASGYFIERAASPAGDFTPVGGVGPNVFSFIDISASNNGTYYYRVKPSNTKNMYSPVATVQTAPICAANYTSACAIESGVSSDIINDFIVKNHTNSITLISNTNSGCSPNSYGNFTNLSATVNVGSTYNFIMRTFYGSNGYYRQHIGVFIDLNHNGNFSDPGEEVYQSSGNNVMVGTTEIDGSFTIPASASGGNTYLRVRTQHQNQLVTTACGVYNDGETEDYTLNIAAALPVTLVDFDGKNTPQGNLLTWKTESEVQSDHFDIERSPNGQAFETTGQTKAAGKAAAYSFLDDHNPYPVSYYRLKMIDLDGKYQYSKIVVIETPGAKSHYILFPNPTTGNLNVRASFSDRGTAQFALYNLLGQKVYSSAQTIEKGLNESTLDISALPGGVYVGEIEDAGGGTIKIGRIIKY